MFRFQCHLINQYSFKFLLVDFPQSRFVSSSLFKLRRRLEPTHPTVCFHPWYNYRQRHFCTVLAYCFSETIYSFLKVQNFIVYIFFLVEGNNLVKHKFQHTLGRIQLIFYSTTLCCGSIYTQYWLQNLFYIKSYINVAIFNFILILE